MTSVLVNRTMRRLSKSIAIVCILSATCTVAGRLLAQQTTAGTAASVPSALSNTRFILPDRDLPSLVVGNTHIVLCANGTFVMRRGTEYLMDGGMSFASEGWARWGQQVRNGRQTGAWKSDAAGLSLSIDGVLLCNGDGRPTLRYVETVIRVEEGLKFHYEVEPLGELTAAEVGATFHFPIQRYAESSVEFAPEPTTPPPKETAAVVPSSTQFPKSPQSFTLGQFTSDRVIVAKDTPRAVALSVGEPRPWRVFDERSWILNTYRLLFSEKLPSPDLKPGDKVTVEFALALTTDYRPQTTDNRPHLPAEQETTNHQPPTTLFPLPDDTTTRGNWMGNYGSFAYILPGMVGYSPVQGGPGWPIGFKVATGSSTVTPAAWVSPFDCSRDARALYNPTRRKYTAGSFDDRGELFQPGRGPDLLLDIGIPAGVYRLSLYFMDIDWIQYRSYEMTIQSGDRLLWKGNFEDFFNGVYKRFLVRGPQQLRVRISKLDSQNAVISGIFLDKFQPPLPPFLWPDVLQKTTHLISDYDRMRKSAAQDPLKFTAGLPQAQSSFMDTARAECDKETGSRAELLWMMAQCQRAGFEYEEARKTCEELLRAFSPSKEQDLLAFAEGLTKVGDYDFAGRAYETYFARRLGSLQGPHRKETCAELLRKLTLAANRLSEAKANEPATRLYGLALRRSDAKRDETDLHWRRGQVFEGVYDYESALSDYAEVSEAIPSGHAPEALYRSQRMLTGLGRYDEAGERLQRLATSYPEYQPVQVKLSLAKNLCSRRQYATAQSLLDATIQSLKEPDAKFWLPILTKVKHNVLMAKAQSGES